MFVGFQYGAFQYNFGYSTGLLGGKAYSYVSPYDRHKDEWELLAKKRIQAAQLDEEIALAQRQQQIAEANRLEAESLKQRKEAKKLAGLEATLQEEINVLRIERVRLMRWIAEEESILVILLSMPL